MNKKADGGLVILLIIVIIVFFFGWLINIGQRECRSNRDCGSEAYCGSDFSCHNYPNIQKTVVQYNFIGPSIIIGIAVIIAAIILKWSKSKAKETADKETKANNIKPAEEIEQVTEPYYNTEPYYKSGNIKAP